MGMLRTATAHRVRDLLPYEVTRRQAVLIAAWVMIAIQLAFRSWAAYGGWFYGDDLKFLSDAAAQPLTLDYLFTRHQQQLMPGGLLISWIIGQGPAWSWGLAATSVVIMQAFASVACLLMLRALFGWAPAILLPLGFYLYSPLTLGAFMWWAASLNQLPMQIAFFLVIASHVRYVRTGRWRWAGASVLIVLVAVLFYVKSVLIVPLLVLFTVTHLTDGSPLERVRFALRRYGVLWVGYAAVSVGYLVAYALSGTSPVGTGQDADYLQTADRQIRETLGPALTGGPWRWLFQGRPDVVSNAPEFAITLSWVVITAVVVGTCWRRVGSWRGWALLIAYLIPTLYLTASGRSTLFGPDVGLYVRYLSDVSVVACLALALVLCPLAGERDARTRGLSPPVSVRSLATVGVAIFMVGSFWSSIRYVDHWHDESAAERYVRSARSDLDGITGLSVVDEPVAPDLVLAPNAPYDRPTLLLAPLRKNLQPVTRGTDLKMFGTDGRLGPAVVSPGIVSDLPPDSDCGALVKGNRRVVVPLRGRVTDDRWWVSLAYLASQDGKVRLTVGPRSTIETIEDGPHTLFLVSSGSYDRVAIQALTPDLGLCVNQVTVGFIGTFN